MPEGPILPTHDSRKPESPESPTPDSSSGTLTPEKSEHPRMPESPILPTPDSSSGTLTPEKLERQPTADPEEPVRRSIGERCNTYFSTKVETKHGYLPLLVCCFATGLTDGTVYNAYGTFVSMQTGNTIFIALGTSHQNNRPYGWARSLCSIGCFAIGCAFFARMHKFIGGHRLRRTVFISFFLQTICVMVAAALISSGEISGRTSSNRDPFKVNFAEMGVVALLSFQAAGQIVNSRGLGVGEVPTVVITSLLCDLVSDELLLAGLTKNGKRNRRLIGFVLTLVGAIVGGWMSKGTGQIGPSLWFLMGIKACICVYWLAIGYLPRPTKRA